MGEKTGLELVCQKSQFNDFGTAGAGAMAKNPLAQGGIRIVCVVIFKSAGLVQNLMSGGQTVRGRLTAWVLVFSIFIHFGTFHGDRGAAGHVCAEKLLLFSRFHCPGILSVAGMTV